MRGNKSSTESVLDGKALDAPVYKVLVEAAPDAMVVIDSTGAIILVNRQFELMFGYERDEILGQTIEALVPEGVRQRHRVHRDGYFAEPKFRAMGSNFELRACRKDGIEFPVEISLSPLQTEAGAMATAAIRDISDKKKVGEQFRALLDAAPDAMVIVDSEARITLVNEQTEQVFGYKREALIGKNVTVLMPERFRNNHAQHTERFFKQPNVRPMGLGLELYGRRIDGAEFPIEISLSPIETEHGHQAIAAIRDISDRKKASERFRALLETAPDSMVIVNRNGNIIIVNQQAEQMFGYKREEMVGKNVAMLMPARYRQAHSGHTLSYFEKPNVRPMGRDLELFGIRKDGVEFPIEISLSPIETEDGVNATAAIRDITDRRNAERKMKRYLEKIEQSNRDLEQFANVASHDLREPLRKIRTFCDRLNAKYRQAMNEDGHQYIDRMIDSADRMSLLMENLLIYSRLSSSHNPYEQVDLGQVLADVLSDLETIVDESGAVIEIGDMPVIEGDAHQMRRLMQNLLSNALKFRREGVRPEIRISSCPSRWVENTAGDWEDFVDITIEDNGIGVPAEYRQKIFDMFQRLHSRTEYSGTGVGLAIVERIVNQHGGRVNVEGAAAGSGARFTVTLPVWQSESRVRHE